MTRHPAVLVCTCNHLEVDHVRSRTSFPHPPSAGKCLVNGCPCTKFHNADDDTQEKAA